jgi:hypothetical protein
MTYFEESTSALDTNNIYLIDYYYFDIYFDDAA